MNNIQPNWDNISKIKGYAVLFGNLQSGWHINNSAFEGTNLQYFWKKACKFSTSYRIGDVTLYLNGKFIRACRNFDSYVTCKLHGDPNRYEKYPTVYTKKINGLFYDNGKPRNKS